MQFAEKYLWLSSCTGIELHILPDNSCSLRYCSVSVHKNELSVTVKGRLNGPVNESIKKLPSGLPLSVAFTGKGVLIKRIEHTEVISESSLSKIFPALKFDEFYIQHFTSGKHSFIALIRRETADQFIKLFTDAGFRVLNSSLGPFVSSHILPQLNIYGDQPSFDGHVITLENGHWENYRYVSGTRSDYPVKIDMEALPQECIIAYGSAFQLALYNRLTIIGAGIPEITASSADFKEERKFKFTFIAALAGIFILLMLNFLLFSYYDSANTQLLAAVSRSSADITHYEAIERQLKTKKQQLNDLGWKKGIRHAFLLDRIGQRVPPAIVLTTLRINYPPLAATAGQRGNDAGSIELSGEAPEPGAVNTWIYLLRDEPWVKDVSLNSFEPEEETGLQKFNLTVAY